MEKIIIIGSGPAAYTAAIYCARANLNPLVLEGFKSGVVGGQLMTTLEVENFPGFPDSILGPKLIDNFKQQAIKFGANCMMEDVVDITIDKDSFEVITTKEKRKAQCVIVATGAMANRLDIEGTRDNEFWQKGVSACAVCDGAAPIFKNKNLFVIGGGDTAAEEACFLTKYTEHVFLVHRRDKLRASLILQKRVLKDPKITVLWNSVLKKAEGDKILTHVIIENVIDK